MSPSTAMADPHKRIVWAVRWALVTIITQEHCLGCLWIEYTTLFPRFQEKRSRRMPKLNVKEQKNSINIQLSYVTYSKYSGECSTMVIHSWASSFDFRSEDFYDQDKEEYDPLDDRFTISGIEVENKTYLFQMADGAFSFPEADELEMKPLILHGPDVINGHEDEDFFVGVIANVHNKPPLCYNWFRNENPLCSGPCRSIIRVSEPGKYFCTVQYGEKKLKSSTVDILADVQANTMENPAEHSSSEAANPPSVSVVTLMKMGKIKIPK